jgi:ankyrin repeat protein
LAGASSINNDLLYYETLRTAVNNGNWDAASDFLKSQEHAMSAKISDHGRTVLHVAVFAGRERIVEKLVELMSEVELEIKDVNGVTALAQAVILQNIGMVDCMLTKNTNLLQIQDNSKRIPLIAALEYGNIEVARHLYSVSLPYQTLSETESSTALTLFILLNDFGKDPIP